MDWFIEKASKQLETRHLVNKSDLEVYCFGLECALLKMVHIMSYFLIGLCMGELLSLIVSGCVLILLRRKTGGYHAKTRIGCYIFSCSMVVILCFLNKFPILPIIDIMGVIITDVLIILFAPIENENRELEVDEKILFRKQAIGYLVVVNIIVVIIILINKYSFITIWLENGLILTGVLLVLGIIGNGSVINV